jgi:hypothetical protein
MNYAKLKKFKNVIVIFIIGATIAFSGIYAIYNYIYVNDISNNSAIINLNDTHIQTAQGSWTDGQ